MGTIFHNLSPCLCSSILIFSPLSTIPLDYGPYSAVFRVEEF